MQRQRPTNPICQAGVWLLVLSLCGGAAFAGGEARKAPFEVLSATVDPLYDSLLEFGQRGWLGADGAVSVPLGEDKIIWFFGDTIVGYVTPQGERKGAPGIRNSIGIQDLTAPSPGKMTYYWDLTDGVPGSFFMAENFDRDYLYWPLTA